MGRKAASPYVYCYPSAIVGTVRLRDTYPPDPQMNATSAWFLTNHEPGRLKYITVAPPDIAEALNYGDDEDRRHEQACRLLLDQTAGLSGDRSITALLKEMRTANAAIGGFGLIDLPAPEPDRRPRFTTQSMVGEGVSFRGPAARQSRNIANLLQPHGVSLSRLIEEGAVGEYSYCLFDKDGNGREEWEFFVTPGYPNSVQFYKDMVEDGFPVIGVGNLATLPAIRAALIGKIINVIVTDIATAKELTYFFQTHKVWAEGMENGLRRLLKEYADGGIDRDDCLRCGAGDIRKYGPNGKWTNQQIELRISQFAQEMETALEKPSQSPAEDAD
jgi:hypothetical protein